MSDRIKGITIEFRGDTTSLNKALATINTEAKKTNRSLREIDRALKLSPNSVKLLSEKQRLLTRRVTESTEKVNALRQAYEKAKADPSIDKKSEDFRELQREIVKAEAYQKRFAREMVLFGNAKFTALGNGLMDVGKKLTQVTRGARMAAGALAGIALYKGFERLKTLDSVSKELEKLGYSGDALEKKMDAAKYSVSGTTFALTVMSKVMKGALGAGVESKYPLDKYLERVADLSAVGGVSVEKMGAMMNKALSKGTVDAKLLNQMNANGIPIYNLLAESMGVSTDELMKLVRTGQVGFDDLYKATEKYEGIAKSLGTETLSGAVTVLGQQFGLIGADFLQGAYEPIKNGVQAIVKKLKELQSNGTIKSWGVAVGQAIKYFVETFKYGSASVDGLTGRAEKLIKAFNPVVTFIGKLVQAFMNLPTWVKLAAAGFLLFGGPLLTIMGMFIKFLGIISQFMQLVKIVGSLWKAFSLLLGVNPILLAIVAGIAALVAIGVVIYKHWDAIKAFAIKTWSAIKNGIVQFATGIKTGVVNAFNSMKTSVVNYITNLKTKAVSLFTNLKSSVSSIFRSIKSTASSVWNSIKSAITTPIKSAKDTVKKAVEKLKSFFPLKIGKIFSGLKLPHFKVSGGSAPYGLFGKGKKPSISVSWYKKAMQNPYMFNNATLFGAGEAGDEVLYGRSNLMRDIASAVAGASLNGVVVNVYGSDNMSVNELAAAVEQRLITMQKRRTQAWA